MVICHCHAINDRRIREEIASGALDAELLAERCGAGTGCGSCVAVVESILATVVDVRTAGRVPAHAG